MDPKPVSKKTKLYFIYKVLNKTSIQIALFIAAICTTLLLFLNFYVTWKAREEFNTIAEQIQMRSEEDWPSERPKGPRIPVDEIVRERLNTSINTVTVIAIISSLGLGIVAASFITKPLNQLNSGLKNVRKNNYKQKLKKTGTEEFDQVIVEFNKLVKQLDAVEKLRKNLISDTSHELKTPLTSLKGQLQGIKDGVLQLDAARIELLSDQVERLNVLVEKLQEYSVIRSKQLQINIQEIDLYHSVNACIEIFKTAAKAKGIDIKNLVSQGDLLHADQQFLQRILNNIIDNSIKYSQGTEITITFSRQMLVIYDNGVGVPEKHLPFLFERFYRVDHSRNRATGGMGLGLAIVKELVEAHHWSIQVTNNPEKGLRFEINTACTN